MEKLLIGLLLNHSHIKRETTQHFLAKKKPQQILRLFCNFAVWIPSTRETRDVNFYFELT